MALRITLAAAAAAAIIVGFALPTLRGGHAEARSQIDTIELHR
jgi:hypothetical protein